MDTPKHTPGPWNAESCIVRDKTRQIRIAKCDESWQLDWREMEANADLIAAAPDLLEAAKGIINSIENGNGVVCYRALMAAIVKAEGGAE